MQHCFMCDKTTITEMKNNFNKKTFLKQQQQQQQQKDTKGKDKNKLFNSLLNFRKFFKDN